MKLFLLYILCGIILFDPTVNELSTSHAIYVSVLEIEQEQDNDKGIVRVKIFGDDLEDAIFNQAKQRLDLLSGDCVNSEALIGNYFNDHLKFKIDGKEQDYYFLSCEVNDISLWLTFKFASPPVWSEVEITADYLMELFPTQSNVVSVTYRTEKKMFRLTKGAATESISF